MKLNRFARYAWFVVAVNLLVIVWGAYVRASVSGDGCGSHWPLCNGEVIPTTGLTKTLIELTHRVTSGLALLLVVALVVAAFRSYPKGHRVRRSALAVLLFILAEALLGAGLVLFGLVAKNDTVARAVVGSVHLVNTFLLVAALTLTAWYAAGGAGINWRGRGAARWLLGVGVVGMLLLAVSGSVAALGDTLFPSGSLAEGMRQDFSPAAHFLLRLRVLHPTLAVLMGGYVVAVSLYVSRILRGGATWGRRFSSTLLVLFFVQLAAGVLNLYLLAPVWMQLLHLLLADLLWIAFVLFGAATLAQIAEQPTRAGAVKLRAAVSA